ncbi:hypothetical protein DPMN_160752 [Dreissena polymorpha]|uniref:Uncharacterized protein n=1 Tax=Dreissena polymorpha TaxID=45954 RepID=A0A9D4EM54_DREPO|nr:hypothetical protein DPMN_160752 [Dreissena polymorpha]
MRKLPPPSSHVIQLTGTIFELNSRIKETNVLSKFHENWAKNVTSPKNAPPTGGHVYSPIQTIFKLVIAINKTNVLTSFHDDWAKIVTSRVFTRENCHYIHIEKNAPHTGSHTSIKPMKTAPPTGGHVFQRIGTTFELNQDIIKTNILTNFELGREFIGTKLQTKFHVDGTRNVASRVFTSKFTKAHLSNQNADAGIYFIYNNRAKKNHNSDTGTQKSTSNHNTDDDY